MEETQTALGDPSVAALVVALRIFAARGRAIREAQAKQENPNALQCNCVESDSADSQGLSRIGNTASEKEGETGMG